MLNRRNTYPKKMIIYATCIVLLLLLSLQHEKINKMTAISKPRSREIFFGKGLLINDENTPTDDFSTTVIIKTNKLVNLVDRVVVHLSNNKNERMDFEIKEGYPSKIFVPYKFYKKAPLLVSFDINDLLNGFINKPIKIDYYLIKEYINQYNNKKIKIVLDNFRIKEIKIQ